MFKVNIWSFYLNFPFRTLNLQIMFNYANPENSIELSCISDFVLKVYSYFTVHKHRIQIHLHNYQQESLLFLCVGYHWLKICVGGHCGHGHYPVVVVIISTLLAPHLPTQWSLLQSIIYSLFETRFTDIEHYVSVKSIKVPPGINISLKTFNELYHSLIELYLIKQYE